MRRGLKRFVQNYLVSAPVYCWKLFPDEKGIETTKASHSDLGNESLEAVPR